MAREGAAPVIHTLVVHKGLVYVSDREVKNLRIFDLNGKPVRDIQMKNLICGFYVDRKDQLWMTTGQDGQLMRLDWNGNILGVIGKEGFGANDFGEAHYMTMTPDGKTIYISDTVNNDVKRLERVD
jgi:sugar lactone lactonase YvrE